MNKKPAKQTLGHVKVQMNSVYTRSKPAKRSFALVVNGVLMTTALIGQLVLGGGSALAAPSSPSLSSPIAAAQKQTIPSGYETHVYDEDTYVSNLNIAVAALKESGWSIEIVTQVTDSLSAIEEKMDEGFSFQGESLRTALANTKIVVTIQGGDGLSALRGQSNTLMSQINRIKERLDGTSTGLTGKGKVMVESVQKKDPVVVIDNVVQNYPQPPIMMNGSVLVPLRGIFETLGAKVDWDGATETVTATKGSTMIKLTVGQSEATVNGKTVKLAIPSQKVNGSTMVPLRFVSESLGGTVRWDGATYTVFIESAVGGSGNTSTTNDVMPKGTVLPAEQVRIVDMDGKFIEYRNFKKRTVRYGRHDYGSLNQSQYDTVMKIVDKAVAGLDKVDISQEEMYLTEYMNGARWSGDKGDRSERNKGLYYTEQRYGEMVADGVSKDEIVKIIKARILSTHLVEKAKDIGEAPFSAYQALIELNRGCESISQVDSAVFDVLGYNTMIYGPEGHAESAIMINGKWYNLTGLQRLPTFDQWEKDFFIFVQPTDGSKITLKH
ncbi:stalk domain-containing protein [Paenibacillus sp. GYB003]|uniref:stalk domain-containing protein n=1 Tax=Paenibacillus sp. GYB003 TaxID=2994392 RepID=UPI002F96DFE1